MRRTAAVLVLSAVAGWAQPRPEVLGARIRADVKFLSSDLLEGRGVGTRGGELAVEYLAAQLALTGVKPAGDNGTYFQRVPMLGVQTLPDAALSVQAKSGPVRLKWQEEFVGGTQRQVAEEKFTADAVFVGHGIHAPEFGWDDYAGMDVKGKVVVAFTNEPPSTDPKFFGGPALTYYGRWVYKFEEAARQGARGMVLIHTTPTAGYGWDVVRNSWGKEDPQMVLEAGQPALAFAGWMTADAAKRAFGRDLNELLRQADTRGFRAISMGLPITVDLRTKRRQIESRNVVGIIPGNDAAVKDEAVMYTAHWDHLGISVPVNGDAIYNGAVDNATGCGVVLDLARAWSMLAQKPRRSALFLFVTAEESGLRGSEYYGRHPVVPLAKTAVDINYDALFPFGRTQDIYVTGAERTTLWPTVQSMAERMRLQIQPDPRPEQGSFYRSDHFSLARVGVPAFTVKMGNRFYGRSAEYGAEIFREYNERHYHQPSDEFKDDWDFSGIEEMGRLGFLIGMDAANQGLLPEWVKGDEFAMGRK